MLTVQILDCGETFFLPLEPRSVAIGSGDDADLQLNEAGVVAEHARIEPVDGGFELVDAGGGTIVNGASITRARLALGDRIEIGRAVLVVGQRVARPSTARDVLGDALVTSGRRRRRPRRQKKSGAGLAIAAVIAALVLVFVVINGGDGVPDSFARVEATARTGDFAGARRQIETLRRSWGDASAARTASVDALAARVDALGSAVQARRATLRAQAASKSRDDQVLELRKTQREDPDGVAGRAARILLADLDAVRRGALQPEVAPATEPSLVADGPSAPDPNVGTARAALDAARSPALAEIERVYGRGEARKALALIDAALAAASSTEAVRMRELRNELRHSLEAEVEALVARARSRAASGRVADLDAAIAALSAERERFADERGAILTAELERLGIVRERARGATVATATVAELESEAHAADTRGDFAKALETVAALVARAAGDAARTRQLEAWRDELLALRALEQHLAAHAAPDGSVAVASRDGAPMTLVAKGDRLQAADGGPVPWTTLAPDVEPTLASEAALLGAVALAYRAGDAASAERLLVRLADPGRDLRPALAAVVARGRGERADEARGYRLVQGALVSLREIESRAAAARIERRLAQALARDAAARSNELQAILAEGPDVADAVVVVLHKQLDDRLAKLESHAFKKVWDTVAERSAELDRRRTKALELIFDEQRYFYPFRPPACDGARAGEYAKVQASVDELAAAVLEVWDDRAPGKRVPGTLTKLVEDVDWLVAALGGFGEPAPQRLAQLEWVRTLPRDGALTIRNFCRTAAERARLDDVERVLAMNEQHRSAVSRAEWDSIDLTNSYRLLLGRRPLAINKKLHVAAHGHAEEMARLGYFSHFSPTPGQKTPFERMSRAGYRCGIAENIANHPSAASAHTGWTHSSGHHRNMLMDSHTEFAVGNDAEYWVQNYGHGDEYLRDAGF